MHGTAGLPAAEDLARDIAGVLGHELGTFTAGAGHKDLRFARCRRCKRSGHYEAGCPDESLAGSVFVEICEPLGKMSPLPS
jgi:hypothetical protein